MEIPDDMKAIPLTCFHNGRKKILPVEEAHNLLWIVTLGWVMLSDFFRTGGGKQAKRGFLAKIVQGSAIKFAFNILTHGSLALAREDSCFADEHGDPPDRDLFAVWAYRFGKLFKKGLRPYEHVAFTDPNGHRRFGYRMKPGETWLVIVEVDPDSGFGNEDVDWTLFETPPDSPDNPV